MLQGRLWTGGERAHMLFCLFKGRTNLDKELGMAADSTQLGLKASEVKSREQLRGERGVRDEDLRLVAAIQAGDERAFLSLVERHHRAMVRLAGTYVPPGAAEEVAQEAWIGVLKGLHKFEGRSSLKAWIFRILVNCAQFRGAREARAVPFSSFETESDEPSVPGE